MSHHPIIKAAAKEAKMSIRDLLTDRKQEATAWRQVVMSIMRDNGMSLAEIAAATSRHTSTVHASCKKLDKLMTKEWFRALRDRIHARSKTISKPNPYWHNPPPRLYMMAWSTPD